MKIYKLSIQGIFEKYYFSDKSDAEKTYRVTFSKVENKPTYEVEEIEILERWTHL